MLQKYDIGDQWELSKCFDFIWSTNYSLLFKALPWYQVSYDLPSVKSTSALNAFKFA